MKLQGLSENRDGPSDSDNYKTKLDDSNIRRPFLGPRFCALTVACGLEFQAIGNSYFFRRHGI